MKKLMLLIICCLMTVFVQAQTEHLKFMGIPIDGKIRQFQKELKKKGFRQASSEDDKRMYKGYFYGDEASVLALFDKSSDSVYQVAVMIPCYNEDIALLKYNELKKNFISKYRAYDLSTYQMVYQNSGASLEKNILSGACTSLNYSREYKKADGTKITEICISEPPVANRYIESDTLPFSVIMMQNYANTGMITINSFKSEVSSFSREMLKYRNGVAILYSDTKNGRMARLKKEEDL